jgi:hypothetical protein
MLFTTTPPKKEPMAFNHTTWQSPLHHQIEFNGNLILCFFSNGPFSFGDSLLHTTFKNKKTRVILETKCKQHIWKNKKKLDFWVYFFYFFVAILEQLPNGKYFHHQLALIIKKLKFIDSLGAFTICKTRTIKLLKQFTYKFMSFPTPFIKP